MSARGSTFNWSTVNLFEFTVVSFVISLQSFLHAEYFTVFLLLSCCLLCSSFFLEFLFDPEGVPQRMWGILGTGLGSRF